MTTRDKARSLRGEGMTLSAIGGILGVSKQRVAILLRTEGPRCPTCGKASTGVHGYCRNPCSPKDMRKSRIHLGKPVDEAVAVA